MKKILLIAILIFTISCSNNKEVKQVAAISCGQCKFDLDSEEGCSLAVKIDEKAYFVDGFNIDDFGDAHDKHTGFCEVIRQAEVIGVVENNRFKAKEIKLLEMK